MKGLTFEQNPVLRDWLCQRLEIPRLQQDSKTIAVIDEARILAVVAYSAFNGHDCQVSVAGEGHWLSRYTIPVFFKYPFNQLGCRRMTAFCRDSNDRVQRFAVKFGFKREGILRSYFEDGADCHIFGLLKEDCRFLGV